MTGTHLRDVGRLRIKGASRASLLAREDAWYQGHYPQKPFAPQAQEDSDVPTYAVTSPHGTALAAEEDAALTAEVLLAEQQARTAREDLALVFEEEAAHIAANRPPATVRNDGKAFAVLTLLLLTGELGTLYPVGVWFAGVDVDAPLEQPASLLAAGAFCVGLAATSLFPALAAEVVSAGRWSWTKAGWTLVHGGVTVALGLFRSAVALEMNGLPLEGAFADRLLAGLAAVALLLPLAVAWTACASYSAFRAADAEDQAREGLARRRALADAEVSRVERSIVERRERREQLARLLDEAEGAHRRDLREQRAALHAWEEQRLHFGAGHRAHLAAVSAELDVADAVLAARARRLAALRVVLVAFGSLLAATPAWLISLPGRAIAWLIQLPVRTLECIFEGLATVGQAWFAMLRAIRRASQEARTDGRAARQGSPHIQEAV